MNTLKRLFAIALCLALTLTCLAACHEKGEIAVKIGDVEFTSGYYACALVFADSEARTTVEENLTEDDGSLPKEIDYYKQKIDDTDYVEWVENKAIESLREIAAVKMLCDKGEVELDEETAAMAETNAEYMWDSYGYSVLMEPNGVAESTFKQYMADSYLADEYFEFVYGKGGEKEIAADKLTKQLKDNYVLANRLQVSFSEKKDDEIKELKKKFEGYEKDLSSGKRDFEEIYLEYNEISEKDHTHEEAEEGELEPKDHHATILGSEDTAYTSDQYDDAKKMKTGEVKLITLDDNEGLVLLVKQDIADDPYYIDYLDTTLRQEIVGDDFTDEIAEYGKELKCDINEYSTKQFKVKKITYPEA